MSIGAAAVIAAAAPVSWVQQGLAAMSETDGHGDTCGPIVIADYIHVVQGLTLSVQEIDTLRSEYIAAGLMNTPQYTGMTATSISAALQKFHGVTPLKVVPWGQATFDSFHSDLINALIAHQAVIQETTNASALPGNQGNVQNHFILHWGIQSDIGYYACNGDTTIALNQGGVVGPVWYNRGNLAAAGVGAYLILPGLPSPDIPDAITLIKAAQASLTASLAKLA